ncbi:hypothetical protein PPYR_07086 [Photinus pyralis]|uniref:HTH CENPB-type domain-containing protein n=2 Tax=Photinus pyralis TaxID=7054 RepID=A0A5N4APH8_PHOPY|nr:uncharacterized protein LOC116163927 [Photinus pyralis]XP_031341353.1 uncharacterized protein LOC116169408 [Photinus pyralis]KAB0799206.1 hypothetical protein PPYR_07086 [Photinus pyralis]
MPTVYTKKCPSRGKWTEEMLRTAVQSVSDGTDINEAARIYNIPLRTLKRRIEKKNFTKGRMGPASLLGEEGEKKMVQHIKRLQERGFTPTRLDVREMAFRLAEKLKIPHKFDSEKQLAGYDWLASFLRRNPELSVRKAEGLSRQRSLGMNKNIVQNYFQLLKNILEEHNLFNKPSNIYNMDESGLQLNNRPGEVIAGKGSKVVTALTAAEKGETITVVACCNGEGTFLPPACIFKGKNKKAEFEDGMPAGSVVYMCQKSAYINSDIFLEWLKTHFLPRKPAGKVLLLLDGHASHCNSIETLSFAEEHDIILLCLPPHTTHYLQPLDRAFFKSLKSAFYQACNVWVKTNADRRITRLVFGKLLNIAWGKAASVQNGTSGFKATGISPYNPDSIPDYAYTTGPEDAEGDKLDLEQPQRSSPQPSTSQEIPQNEEPRSAPQIHPDPIDEAEKLTPGKALTIVAPVPSVAVLNVTKRARKVAEELTSPENIEKRRKIQQAKNDALLKKKSSTKGKRKPLSVSVKGKMSASTVPKGRKALSDSSDGESDISLHDSSTNEENDDDTACTGCGEQYHTTKKKEDWIKCLHCENWLHEGCSKFENLCEYCAKLLLKKKN